MKKTSRIFRSWLLMLLLLGSQHASFALGDDTTALRESRQHPSTNRDHSASIFARTASASCVAIIATIAGGDTSGYSGDGGPATASYMFGPAAVCVDARNNIYVGEVMNNVVRKITPSGIITTIAGCFSCSGYTYGGAATAVNLHSPSGIAVDRKGNVYITGAGVVKVDTSGTITMFAGGGSSCGSCGDGGPATAAWLGFTTGVCFDTAGNLYVVDLTNRRIRKVDTSGIITTVAGNGSSAFSGDGGAATQAGFDRPRGVAIDAAGNIYCADQFHQRIRKVNPSGIISTLAGTGTIGFSGDGGPATLAKLNYPTGVAVDALGNVYVAETGNNVIRKIDTAGIISTIVGTDSAGFRGDGHPATAARLDYPSNVCFDPAGNMYIADQFNNRVRKISTDPVVPDISGNTRLCIGTSIPMADSMTGGLWSSADSTIATVNPTSGLVTAVASGTVEITYSVTSPCGTGYATHAVTVAPGATISAIGGPGSVNPGRTITLSDATPGGSWNCSNTSIATVSSSGNVRGLTSGSVVITYSIAAACGTNYVTKTVNVTSRTSVAELGATSNEGEPNVYPNPNNGTFTIEFPCQSCHSTAIALDMYGRELETKHTDERMMYFDLSGYPAGIYFVKINAGGREFVKKVVVR